MITKSEYVLTLLFWIPLSILSAILIYPGINVDFLSTNMVDDAVCGIIFLFGTIRCILSSMQVSGVRFYGGRDCFDIFASFICMITIPSLLYFGHVECELWMKKLPPVPILLSMGATFFLFLFLAIKAIHKYHMARHVLSNRFVWID